MAEERNIAVLMGGISPERKISLQSGKAVANALEKTDNHVIKIVVNDELPDAIKHTGHHSTEVLIEKYIEGRELTVSILDDKALPVIEIKTATGFYDYDAKHKSKNTQYIILESAEKSSECTLSHAVYDRVQELAIRAHNSLGCRTFSRVDMVLGSDGEIYILKSNTIPEFTERSLLPKAAAAANISFTELCSIIVDAAFKYTFSPARPTGLSGREQTIRADIQDKKTAKIST